MKIIILYTLSLLFLDPQMSVRMCESANVGPQVSVRIFRSANVGPQVSVRMCESANVGSANVGPQVQVRKCRSASANPQVSQRPPNIQSKNLKHENNRMRIITNWLRLIYCVQISYTKLVNKSGIKLYEYALHTCNVMYMMIDDVVVTVAFIVKSQK